MIKKLAREIHDVIENDDDSGGGAYMRAARACLEALREPSDAMLDAAPDSAEWVRDVWQSMIDVALLENR